MTLIKCEIHVVLGEKMPSLRAQCLVKPDGKFPPDSCTIELDEYVDDGIKDLFRVAMEKLIGSGVIAKLVEAKYTG